MPAWNKNKDKLQSEVPEMWRVFLAATSDSTTGSVVCVLDALDECRGDDRKQLITWLCDFHRQSSSSTSNSKLRFLVTSRPYDDVQRWFKRIPSFLPQIRLRGEDENDAIHAEINLVINKQVDELAAEFRLSGERRERLANTLLQMQHRTYL